MKLTPNPLFAIPTRTPGHHADGVAPGADPRAKLPDAPAPGSAYVNDLRAMGRAGGRGDTASEARAGAGQPAHKRIQARASTKATGSANPSNVTTRPKINTLPSGPKIDTSHDAHKTIDSLAPHDIDQLSAAFGLVKPGETGNRASNTMAIRQRIAVIANDLDNHLIDHDNNSFLDHPAITSKLSAAEAHELKQLLDVAHVYVKSRSFNGPSGPHAMLEMHFDGTRNFRDVRQDVSTAMGLTGQIDHASRRIGELMSRMLAPNGNATLMSVSGLSMGGGAAQVFMAAIDSRLELATRPAVLLLDPVLLNNRQARFAVEGGTRPVDFTSPRGVAVTLDYARDSQRGLMSKMKTVGFHSPGLVRLKLGLDDQDGLRYGEQKPKATPIGMGYHGRTGYYTEALKRFAGDGAQHR
ncbi:hypothetical protein [Pandoraea anhela]|uniref:Type III effector protein n=1 Tax=Pandoraea anhela TaxID=2508295 RepID=A0A5E4RAT8_9BURK|nr:hypothetical protein [Pandoraea anhela]VVD59622.1 hypothetical protein PAN31108_00038 [Pandoraea anhela]